MMHRDGFDLMLSEPEDRERIHPNGPQGLWDLYVRVTDVQQQIATLRGAGVRVDRGPTHTEYEMLEIEVLDPDGYRICFGQNVE
jgi:catechol 2,3-dioxygenase-like lactoylglutathione lyase family enzyme